MQPQKTIKIPVTIRKHVIFKLGSNKKDGYRQQNVRQRQKLISIN